jgi:hypothetical protein
MSVFLVSVLVNALFGFAVMLPGLPEDWGSSRLSLKAEPNRL